MRARLTLVRGAPPNASRAALAGPPSDDPAARRRELMVVLELCAARERGAREWAAPGRALSLVRDSEIDTGTTLVTVRQRSP